MTQAYPLQWPFGKPRTRNPQPSRFGSHSTFSVDRTRRDLATEMRLLGASNVVLSTNIELRKDGEPYSGRRLPDDRGVAVYFTLKGEPRCLACDKWEKVEENIAALRHTIAAMRGIARWGGDGMVEQAFTGFAALPSPTSVAKPWHEVLDVSERAEFSAVKAAYHAKAKRWHPDKEGTDGDMAALNEAYDSFKRARGIK